MRRNDRPIRFSTHAVERMAKRNVSLGQVEAVIRAGAWEQDGLDTNKAFVRTGSQLIQVAFADKGDYLLVITVKDKEW